MSLAVKMEKSKWRKQKTRNKATGHKTLGAMDRWLNRKPELEIGMLEHQCKMTCVSKLFGMDI